MQCYDALPGSFPQVQPAEQSLTADMASQLLKQPLQVTPGVRPCADTYAIRPSEGTLPASEACMVCQGSFQAACQVEGMSCQGALRALVGHDEEVALLQANASLLQCPLQPSPFLRGTTP